MSAIPDPQTETTPDPQTETTPDPQTETTPDPQTETTPDPQTETTPDPETETTPDPETETTSTSTELPGTQHIYEYAGNEVFVNNVVELLAAINDAKPGDIITLSNGSYLAKNKISIYADGTAANPITIRAESYRKSNITFSQSDGIVEGFTVRGKKLDY